MDDEHEGVDAAGVTASTAPSLYTRSVYYRQTRKSGKILKAVKERYLRDDLGLGFHFVEKTKRQRSDVERVYGTPEPIMSTEELKILLRPCKPCSLVVVDTNVLVHNFDVLEHASSAMPNLVIPQTALEECRSHRMVSYDRAMDLLRSTVGGSKRCGIFFPDPFHIATAEPEGKPFATPNDENDARIKQVASFLGEKLQQSDSLNETAAVQVVLLTDDAALRAKCRNESTYKAYSVREWATVLQRENPGLALQDSVAQMNSTTTSGKQELSIKFEPHLEASVLSRGIQSGQYHRGVFRVSSTAADEAYVNIRRGDERVAVTIACSLHRNRAVEGDVVAIALNPLEEWINSSISDSKKVHGTPMSVGIACETAEPKESDIHNISEVVTVDETQDLRPTGRVVGILRRNFENQSGSVYSATASSGPTGPTEQELVAARFEREHPDGTTTCVFFPVNQRIPPILIRTSQRDRLLGQRIVVSLDSWPATSAYPFGHYVRTIGPTGSKDVETQVLLLQHDIPHEPFSAAVLACLPPEDYKIVLDDQTGPKRLDLRHLPVLSIDPPGCKDIDDALHCTVLPNGNYQVGVHIADVTHYVKPGTAIDLEAADRSTSTYLVNRRLDMLPGLLTTDLCSLKGNVDRYAFSVLWEVTPGAEIVDVEFHKTIIHSIAALTYAQAQAFIDQPEGNTGDEKADIQSGAVKRLASLARKFRQRRIDAGALTLASPEVKFVLDSESLNPTDVQAYALLEANALVEEFMLLANVTVAKKILRHYPTLSVLRRHPAPNRSMFESLISKANSIGLAISIEDSKQLADSLDAATVKTDPYINKLLRILSTRCMSPAQYFCSGEFRAPEWHHYGLAAPVYTHFTSPIRRYADVCVHRLLAAAIGVSPLPATMSSRSYLHDLAANMNRRHRAAQLAGRASVQLHTLIFFAEEAAEEDGYVLDVNMDESRSPSFTVIVPRFGIEGSIKLGNIKASDPGLRRFPTEHRFSYHGAEYINGLNVKVFDKVRVKIWVRESSDDQRELVLDLLDSCSDNASSPGMSASGQKRKEDTPKSSSPQKKKRKKRKSSSLLGMAS